jgi:nucleoside-diphosphate-sugar epimerase
MTLDSGDTAELSGLAAVVTGGGSGIGLATARLLASRGARVAVLDLKPGEEFLGLSADVTDDASVRLAVDAAAEGLGGIDILVNNAGIGAIGTVADNPDDQWHQVFDVNVVGMVRVTRAALPYLRRSSHPAIVNTCSVAATAGLPQRALYSATPPTPRGSAGSSTRPTTRPPSGRRSRPASRAAGWSLRPRSRPASRTSHPRRPPPSPARRWRSTAG